MVCSMFCTVKYVTTPVSDSVKLMRYCLIIPFCWFLYGGIQDASSAVEFMALADTFRGGPEGTAVERNISVC